MSLNMAIRFGAKLWLHPLKIVLLVFFVLLVASSEV